MPKAPPPRRRATRAAPASPTSKAASQPRSSKQLSSILAQHKKIFARSDDGKMLEGDSDEEMPSEDDVDGLEGAEESEDDGELRDDLEVSHSCAYQDSF